MVIKYHAKLKNPESKRLFTLWIQIYNIAIKTKLLQQKNQCLPRIRGGGGLTTKGHMGSWGAGMMELFFTLVVVNYTSVKTYLTIYFKNELLSVYNTFKKVGTFKSLAYY